MSPCAARGPHGSEYVLKLLPRKEAAFCLAQVAVRGLPLSPEIGKLANRPGRFEPVKAQRSNGVSDHLSVIDHGVNFA